MSKEEYVIDGAKFSTKKTFYNYLEKHFTYGLTWKIGHNLNAFDDILCGGFGKHDCDEEIIVVWKNLAKSRERLDTNFLDAILEILENHDQVTFQKHEH